MEDPTRPHVIIHLHLPKSGGTSLNAHLARHLEWDREYVNFSEWGNRYRREQSLQDWTDRPEADRQAARALSGHRITTMMHRLLPGREPRYMTIVREPAERCVSLYNFRRSRGVVGTDFKTWYREEFLADPRNSIVGFYADKVFGDRAASDAAENLHVASRLLDRCWLAVDTARLDEALGVVSDALAIPRDWQNQRVAGESGVLDLPNHPSNGERVEKFVTLDDALRSRVMEDRAEDYALWRHACRRPLPEA